MINRRLVDNRDGEFGEFGEFEALSYCWGNIHEQSYIYLSSPGHPPHSPFREFAIPKAAMNAIRHLRLSKKKRTIWIDAVCINQENDTERNQQVSIMSRIYSAAVRVNVWLGEEYPGSSCAMMMIQEMYNSRYRICPGAAKCRCEHARHLRTIPEQDSDETHLALAEVHRIYREHFEDFDATGLSFFGAASALFGNPWFRRVWVLQEVLGSENVLVHCGAQTIPWIELIEICEYMDMHMWKNHDFPQAAMPTVWNSLRAAKQKTHQQPEILDVFLQCLELESSDPRDKIWALLGFGRESNPQIHSKLEDGLRPDYAKPATQVFADFTRWHILEHKSLRVLSAVHGTRGRAWQSMHWTGAAAPSVSRPTWAVGDQGSIHWAQATLRNRFKYCAAADTAIDFELVRNYERADVLSLKGFRVTTIQRKGHFSRQQLSNSEPELRHVFLTIFDPGAAQDTWMCGTRDQLKGRSPDFELGKRLFHHQQAHWDYGPRPGPTFIEIDELGGDLEQTYTLEQRVIPNCIDSCFFVGSNKWVGLCPSGARVGDLAVILCGAEVPFLLRKEPDEESKDYFQFVGECYLQKAMDGKFIHAGINKNKTPELFKLR